MRAFLGLGSNQGNSRRLLREAVEALGSEVVGVSSLYETEPLGGPPGQPPFLNVVVELETDLTPRQLLGVGRRLEADAGRTRSQRWGPRTLDVDVLLVGSLRVDDPDLTVPHPRMNERRFVMAPLAELAPDVVPAGWQQRAVGAVRVAGSL